MRHSTIVVGVSFLFSLASFTFFENNKTVSHYREEYMLNHFSDTILREGDIIFQTSLSSQSKAIQVATHSPLSHCGLVFKKETSWVVLEAVQPVKYTPLKEWILRGKNQHFVLKRLMDTTQLTNSVIAEFKREGEKLLGKNYDLTFEWSDERMYCSELVWKLYFQVTGIELGNLQTLQEFDLSHQEVKTVIKKRYGSKIPYNEKVIAPATIEKSHLLRTVISL